MRRISIPPDVELPPESARLSFTAFVLLLLAADKRFNADVRGAFAAERIANAIKNPIGGVLDLETTDAELLSEVVKAPTDGFPFRPVYLVAPYLRACIEQTGPDGS
jgi:hypothetical protein